MTAMFPNPATHGGFYVAIAVGVVALLIARRIPILRTIVALAGWMLIAALLVVALGRQPMIDPYVDRIMAFLKIDGQTVVGKEVRVRMAPDGHFWIRVRMGGVERRMLVDSGATFTALSAATAAAAGITPEGGVPVLINTANGTIRAESGRVPELRFGTIVARDLSVVISPAFGDVSVLGMNFLSRLQSWRVEGQTLILVPHHPQAPPTAA
ncbi:MAG TPA: TIGR02281 family clan AA aspartic protease [Sphingomonas sp.]|jgi:aspartyl protease family protein|uniref:retropepsin-like aspartic protease family protein n=1 Tax=Sphingomonas sp. TaxID=28214 RepID=UPI002EDACA87